MRGRERAQSELAETYVELQRSHRLLGSIQRVTERFAGATDLEEAVIVARDHVPVRIRDVARVARGPALRRGVLDKGGAEAVGGVVVVRHGANPLATILSVAMMLRYSLDCPAGADAIEAARREGLDIDFARMRLSFMQGLVLDRVEMRAERLPDLINSAMLRQGRAAEAVVSGDRRQLRSKGLSRQASSIMILVVEPASSILASSLPALTQSYSTSFSLPRLASTGMR